MCVIGTLSHTTIHDTPHRLTFHTLSSLLGTVSALLARLSLDSWTAKFLVISDNFIYFHKGSLRRLSYVPREILDSALLVAPLVTL